MSTPFMAEGDHLEKFEEFIREKGTFLYKYIFSLVKHKETAEDLYQETLLTAYSSCSSVHEPKKLKSWFFKIATNKCRDYWRKQKTQNHFWEEGVYQYMKGVKDPQIPEEKLVTKCERNEMIGSIQQLPDGYREPLLLFYYENRTLIEISKDTEMPLSTVKTRMRRGREKLLPKMKMIVGQ